MSEQSQLEADTWYDRFGGEPFFTRLVGRFYALVAEDPLLRPMYPDEDLADAERHLRLFLMQYWGGPKTYGEERGHPRLRLRHAPFPITIAARDRWLLLMRTSLNELELDDLAERELWAYLTSAANAMVNVNPAWSPEV